MSAKKRPVKPKKFRFPPKPSVVGEATIGIVLGRLDIKDYVNDDEVSINVQSWKFDSNGDLKIRVADVDTGQVALQNTQKTASNVSSDLHKTLNYERGVVPVVDTEVIDAWLKRLDREHNIQVFKRRKIGEDDEDSELGDVEEVFPKDGMTLYSALTHMTPLESSEAVVNARIQNRVYQNQAIGDGIRLDVLSHAIKSSLLPRPYSVHNPKMSFGEAEANHTRRRLIKLIEKCFFQDAQSECYASDLWQDTLENKGISDTISGPQSCPAKFNRPNITPFIYEETTPFILTRSNDEDDLECKDKLKISALSDPNGTNQKAQCIIGNHASLWYDALFFTASFLQEQLKKIKNESIGDYTLERDDKKAFIHLPSMKIISSDLVNEDNKLNDQEIDTKMSVTNEYMHAKLIHIPDISAHELNGTYTTLNDLNTFLTGKNDDAYESSNWTDALSEDEKTELTEYIEGDEKHSEIRDILSFVHYLNAKRADVAIENKNLYTFYRELKYFIRQGDKDVKKVSEVKFRDAVIGSVFKILKISDRMNELHYGTDRMHTSVAAIWRGSHNFTKITQIVGRRTVFSLEKHKITKYIKDTLLMPVKITVTGPKSNHCSTQCHLQGYFEETSEYNLAMSAARMEFATIKGGAENAERFLKAIRSDKEEDNSVQLAATLLKACHRANTRLTGTSSSAATKVERQSLEELKHHAMCSFVLNFGHKK